MWLFLAVYLVPVFWMLSTSFKRPGDVAASPPELVPLSPSLDAYGAIVSDPDFLQSFLTSAIVATGTMILTVVLATPAAYGLARWVGRGQSTVGMAFIVAQLLPAIVVATPIFILFSRLELTNT
jgi:multiple sugar transport system permease protein